MNEAIQKIIFNNVWPIFVAVVGVIVFVSGIIISLRADLNSTQFQVHALQESTAPVQSLIKDVSAIKQSTIDTQEKVNQIYDYLLNKGR